MSNPAKEQSIKDLSEMFSKAKSVVLTNYQGITAAELTQLRAHMRKRSLDFKVVKNTLARHACKNTDFSVLEATKIKGPISFVVSYKDVTAPAKALADYAKTDAKQKPQVICGVIEGKKISPEEVKALADLPSKEVLISKMLSVMQGPTTNFVGVFSGLLRKLVGTLTAVQEQKEKSGS